MYILVRVGGVGSYSFQHPIQMIEAEHLMHMRLRALLHSLSSFAQETL